MPTKCKSLPSLLPTQSHRLYALCSKERIEQRGAIAKDVNLDVQIFKPQLRLNLLETILNVKNKQSSK